jgi:SAM-dependent methyltransferase
MPLAYYSRAATEDFWSEHWAGEDVQRLVESASSSPLTDLLEAALPGAGPILEAGCGLGPYVILLRHRGRAVSGVDWSLEALRRCRAAAPSAPVAVMELGRLAVRSGALAAYISLGVVEHDAGGPAAIVAEAARVLAPGGTLLVSVPYWNGTRRLLAPRLVRQADRIRADGGEFYQFAFSRREVRSFLEDGGFAVRSFHPYDPARMWRTRFGRLADQLGATSSNARGSAGRTRRPTARAAVRALLYSPVALRLFGHMILAIAVKR